MVNRNILVAVLIWISGFSAIAQQTIIVTPQEIIRLSQVKYQNFQIRDDPNASPLYPYYETERGLVFIMQDGIYRFDDNFEPHFTAMPTYAMWAGSSTMASSKSVTISGEVGFRILRYGERYLENSSYHSFGSSGNSILIENMVVRRDGSSMVIDSDLTVRVLDRSATLEYAKSNIPDATVVGTELYYRGNKVGRSSYTMIDDDGNFYDYGVVQRDGQFFDFIKIGLPDIWYYVFDHEGNVLAMKHSPDGIIIYYAGRTWGYLEPSRKATVTANNLRIRLRANTNSFVLGRVQDKEQVTVLKIGPTATIGGQTAPWYRIQTANGLVGWVFGSFVEIED